MATSIESTKENAESYTPVFIFSILNTTIRLADEHSPVAGQAIQLVCELEPKRYSKETSYVWIHEDRELHNPEKYGGLDTRVLTIEVLSELDFKWNITFNSIILRTLLIYS